MLVSKRHHLSIVFLALSLMAGLLLSACGSSPTPAAGATVAPTNAGVLEEAAAPATSTPPPTVSDSAYPAPQAEVLPAYPADGQAGVPAPAQLPEGYPPGANSEVFQEPRFRIDLPSLVAGATLVEGQAPPNVALAILDVSYNGALLGTGRSDETGRFSIPVSPALVGGNRIGVTVGELEAGQSLNQMSEAYYPYRGEGFMNLPNVGILFDTALVQP